MIDRKPVGILRCLGVSDVVRAVCYARDARCPISVRASGHNVAGSAIGDGAIVLDVSSLKGIRVDPGRMTVHAEAGVTWRELDHETQAFGLATTGAKVSTVGIAGVTLGGGLGWLMRRYGLVADNLRSVDLVTAYGRFHTVNANEEPELFWGLRGGGNFGVVTSFEYALHPVGPMVTGGMAMYPAARAGEVLRFYREFTAAAPDELGALLTLWTAPSSRFVPAQLHGKLVVSILVCHAGPLDAGERSVAPLRSFGPPAMANIRPMPYTAVQRMIDQAGTFGYQVCVKSDHLANLDDDVVDTFVAHASGMTSPRSVALIFALGGEAGRVGEHDTAVSHRNAAYNYAIYSMWDDPAESERHLGWTHDCWAAMRRFAIGAYVNELGNEGEERVREAYNPATYGRLVTLKNTHDPTNRFRFNQNIKPTAGRPHLEPAGPAAAHGSP
jgi:FAD/FMN-containing dehydrogenase